jgi:hypothetical protein
MRARADEVVAFYRGRIVRGGLTEQPDASSPELPGRCCPGFSADGATDTFLVNVYQWRDLAFWTVYLAHKSRRWKSVSVPLRLLNQAPERFTFWIEHEKQVCWAPPTAVTSDAPIELTERMNTRRRHEREVVPFESMPHWLQFTVSDNVPTVLWRYPDNGPMEQWTARMVLPPDIDPYMAFDSWLDHLEAHGVCCDREGGPDTFYVTVWQRGQMLSAQIQLDGGVQGSIALLNCGERSISVEYTRPRRG